MRWYYPKSLIYEERHEIHSMQRYLVRRQRRIPRRIQERRTTTNATTISHKIVLLVQSSIVTIVVVVLILAISINNNKYAVHATATTRTSINTDNDDDATATIRSLQVSVDQSSWWCPIPSTSTTISTEIDPDTVAMTAQQINSSTTTTTTAGSVVNITIGANTWHQPIIDYLQATIIDQYRNRHQYYSQEDDSLVSNHTTTTTTAMIRFHRRHANDYMNQPTVQQSRDLKYDFIIANPYQSSCYQIEAGAVPIATQYKRYDTEWPGLLTSQNSTASNDNSSNNNNQDDDDDALWTMYGAVLYTTAEKASVSTAPPSTVSWRQPIRTVQDVRGRRIATNKFKNLATHLCYDLLKRNGLHHLQDPAQTVFFKSSIDALEAVLDGRMDVGCASTQTLETYFEYDYVKLNNTIHILGERLDRTVIENGIRRQFPYKISSLFVPTYLVTSFPHQVPDHIQQWVTTTLLEMRSYAIDLAIPFLSETTCIEQCRVVLSPPNTTTSSSTTTNITTVNDDDNDDNDNTKWHWTSLIWNTLPDNDMYDIDDDTQTGMLTSWETCIQQCFEETFRTSNSPLGEEHERHQCNEPVLPSSWMTSVRPPSIVQALRAFYAINTTRVPGFTRPQSNLKMLDIQEGTGMLLKTWNDLAPSSTATLTHQDVVESGGGDSSDGECVRLRSIQDAIHCPSHHFIRDYDPVKIKNHCNSSGLDCFGRECLCKPCIRAHEVDIVMTEASTDAPSSLSTAETSTATLNKDSTSPSPNSISPPINIGSGCDKFQICGSVAQEGTLLINALDNRRRTNANATGVFLKVADVENTVEIAEREERFVMEHIISYSNLTADSFLYQYSWKASRKRVGQVIVQIFVSGEEIPESPFRVLVTERDCSEDAGKEADEYGQCVCQEGTVAIGGRCVRLVVLIPTIVLLILVIGATGMYIYIRYQRQKVNALWKIPPAELSFESPPRILGRGSFGLVLLADYKGTKVAVKGVLPKKTGQTLSGSKGSNYRRKNSIEDMDIEMPIALPKDSRQQDSTSEENDSNEGNADTHEFCSSGESNAANLLVESINRGSWSGMSSIGSKSVFSEYRRKSSNDENIRIDLGDDGSNTSPFYKRYLEQRRQSRMKEQFLEEIRMLSQLRHPSVVCIMGAVVTMSHEPLLVMEYMDFGSLFDIINNDTLFLDNQLKLSMLHDVANGLRFLHNSDVVHGDLKSQNILVDKNFRAKVSDFGCSKYQSKHENTKGCHSEIAVDECGPNSSKKMIRGSPFYMSPELLNGESENSRESDVYAFGIVQFEVWSREEPFKGEIFDEVLADICDPDIDKVPKLPEDCSCPTEARNIMDRCLKFDPSLRPTAMGLDIRLGWLDDGGSSLIQRARQKTVERKTLNSSSAIQSQPSALPETIFPAHVAEALRQGRPREVENHDDVTIIVMELAYSSNEDEFPRKRIDLESILDEVGEGFDQVMRIETIGSSYLFVTNLQNTCGNKHALFAVEFALEVTKIVRRKNLSGSSLGHELVPNEPESRSPLAVPFVKVGLHSGNVLSHVVVGRKTSGTFKDLSASSRFTLIGNTVITAKAIKQSASSTRPIICSEQCYDRLCFNSSSPVTDSSPLTLQGETSSFTVTQSNVVVANGRTKIRTFEIESTDN